MNSSHYTTQDLSLTSWTWMNSSDVSSSPVAVSTSRPAKPRLDLLHPLRQWLDALNVRDAKTARSICKLIPAQCPFERDIKLFGHTIAHIPPMCKLNPVYEQIVGLRFRALCYLADECGEDVTPYC